MNTLQINPPNSIEAGNLIELNVKNSFIWAGSFPLGEMIAIKPICENLGIDRKWQQEKIQEHIVLGQLGGNFKSKGKDGKTYDMYCLPAHAINEWLFEITATEKINMTLWNDYKKNLVVTVLDMLRYSMTEYIKVKQELDLLKTKEQESKNRTIGYINKVEKAADLKRESDSLYKEAKKEKDQLIDFLNSDPSQLRCI